MKRITEQEWMKKLKEDGFANLRICPINPGFNSGEHTHDEHTVHVILSGELKISNKKATKIFRPGERVEFPAGTTHTTRGSRRGSMIVGVKEK